MSKFVFFNYGEGYQKCIINALKDDDEAYSFENFKDTKLKKMFLLHNAWPINKKIEIPFKRIWFKRMLKGVEICEQDDIYFLLYESFHLTYSRTFLRYLKKKYPNSKLCFMFSNPADKYNKTKVGFIKKYLDAIITFNRKDAIENNYLFCPLQPYKVPIYDGQLEEHSDLFFIGVDKGRLEKLLFIYEHLSSKGVKCDFYIVGVPDDKQRYSDKIHYNQRLTYEEVLKKVASTNCVLEVLQNEENYISIRTIEAMQYHTKLLTSSNSIKNSSLYNENIVQVFDEVENIDANFVKTIADNNQFPDELFCSLTQFKHYLLDNVG